ncbi:hypothetical protein JK358_28395 [Nocardia sp. 2]|uniref:Uncharacterized protein n=1 Tax=Nocardia acididurans TaxID=2802282 RepID=A0ABS1MDJ0_9NOCA|nr:hypothetical protein [Nocardia acididurans]MBL1078334.1 hypothetical protein [Nocardia acididurans]
MTTPATRHGTALHLWTEIADRYGSLDAFVTQVRREIDAPTMELPRLDTPQAEVTTPMNLG